MAGGAHHPDVLNWDEDALYNLAIRTMREHLGITQKPDATCVGIAKNAIPQYPVGHITKVQELRMALNRSPQLRGNLKVAGASFDGVALNDCIFSAKETVMSIINEMQ